MPAGLVDGAGLAPERLLRTGIRAAPLDEHEHAVGGEPRLLDVLGREGDGSAALADTLEQRPQRQPVTGIERGGGFVQQTTRGRPSKPDRDVDALRLPEREALDGRSSRRRAPRRQSARRARPPARARRPGARTTPGSRARSAGGRAPGAEARRRSRAAAVVGRCRRWPGGPASSESSVVLPAPFGPSRARRSPVFSASSTGPSTCRPPKRLINPAQAISGASALTRARVVRARCARDRDVEPAAREAARRPGLELDAPVQEDRDLAAHGEQRQRQQRAEDAVQLGARHQREDHQERMGAEGRSHHARHDHVPLELMDGEVEERDPERRDRRVDRARARGRQRAQDRPDVRDDLGRTSPTARGPARSDRPRARRR